MYDWYHSIVILEFYTITDAIATLCPEECNEEVVLGKDIVNSPLRNEETISGSPNFRSLPIHVNEGIHKSSSTKFKSMGAIHALDSNDDTGNRQRDEIDVNIHSLGNTIVILADWIN